MVSPIIALFLGIVTVVILPQAIQAASGKKTLIKPALSYRQAYLDVREDSDYYKDSYKNSTDQLYLSLKFVKTFDLVNEIVLEPAIRTNRDNANETETVIDQAYIDTYLSSLRLTAGKKTEFEGSGYFVNPSDLLNEDKNLFDNLYQNEGKAFSRLGWYSGSFYSSIGFVPKTNNQIKNAKTWFQLGDDIWDTDTRLQYTYNFQDLSTLGLSLSRFFGDSFELHYDGRVQQQQRGVDDEDERIVFDCDAVNAQSITNEERNKVGDELRCPEPDVKETDSSVYSVFGGRVVLTPKRTLILEAIQNTGGLNNDERAMYYRYIRKKAASNAGDTDQAERIIGRQYIFFAFQDEDSLPKSLVNIAVLYNQDDQSSFLNTEYRYSINPLMKAGLIHASFLGDQESEFGEYPFQGATYLTFSGQF